MLTVNVVLRRSAQDDTHVPVFARVFSEWVQCSCSSAVFGDEVTLPWQVVNDDIKEAKFAANVGYDISTPEKLRVFNEKPGIYLVLVSDAAPIGFSYVDCSSFVLDGGTCYAKQTVIGNYEIDFSVSADGAFLPLPEAIKLEPVVLDVKRVSGYPVLDGESLQDAVRSTYIYGEFDLGMGVKRQILGFPHVEHEPPSDADDPLSGAETMNLDLRVCLLPGLIDIPKLKDSFTSSTLVLEVHREDVFARAFHTRNVEEYATLAQADRPKQEAPPDANAGKKGAKAAPAPKKGAPPPVETSATAKTETTEMTAGDRFLLSCIQRALSASRQIRPHGTVRYRLEQLLSSSNDLLARFARKRQGGQPLSGDDTVMVKEDLLIEVRLEKPSRPEKWDLPADLSLRSAMQRAKAEAQSRLDGTLAGTAQRLPALNGISTGRPTGAATSTLSMLAKPTPRHEMFLACNTAVEMSAELHRSLIDPGKDAVDAKASRTKRSPPAKTGRSPSPGGRRRSRGDTSQPAEEEEVPLSDLELQKKLAVTPFTRMVVLFKYTDDETLRAIAAGMNAVNGAALPDIQGTLRSYSLSETELQAAKQAKLDLITGFMIIDDDQRLVVLEGLAAPGKGMQRMFTEFLPKVKPNDDNLRILCNPEVLFPDRSYPEFGPDLRRIRIRDKLPKLARRPEIYNRKQVEEICFEGIDRIMTLRRAEDMESTKKLNMYPIAESLNKLELLYGEAITRPDMDGTLRDAFVENFEMRRSASPNPRSGSAGRASATSLHGTASGGTLGAGRRRDAYQYTDCRNPQFEEHLRSRPEHRTDHLAETRQLRAQAWEQMLRRREQRDEAYEANLRNVLGDEVYEQSKAQGGPKIYLYSTQSLNFKAKAFNQLRERVAQDKNGTYTYSQDFVSQTVCVVDEEQLAKNAKAAHKEAMLTEKGFQYPKPKTTKELLRHPQGPSEARIEDLKEPFRDILDVRPGADAETKDPTLRALEKGFKTQTGAEGLFGGLKPVTFERPFELKLVGDRSQLPRGNLTGGWEPDPQAFRSVHLGGDDQARIIAEAAAKEKKEWQKKVVVDTLTVQVGGFRVRDRPLQMDRTADILKGEPKREELIHLRNRVSHRGEDWSYHPAPLSILTAEPFVSNQAATALLRTTDPTKFITSQMLPAKVSKRAEAKQSLRSLTNELRDSTSMDSSDDSYSDSEDHKGTNGRRTKTQDRPQDFTRYIHKDTFNPKLMSIVARRKHPPQDRTSEECRGPKWEPAGSK